MSLEEIVIHLSVNLILASHQMKETTSIIIRYNKHNAVWEVSQNISAGQDITLDQWFEAAKENSENAEKFGTQSRALAFAVTLYNEMKDEGRAPEGGIKPLYDPLNLSDLKQLTLETWTGVP